MHLIYDENGNLIEHGGHDHHHHEHVHEHQNSESQDSKNETLVLLNYMLEHNDHHAAELQEMSDALEADGFKEAAKQIRDGVSEFHKGNMHLSRAIESVKEKLKEK